MRGKENILSMALIEKLSIPEPNTGCWLWTMYTDKNGYGELRVGGITRKAHRASFAAHGGHTSEGDFVCHKCDTPSCVNPEHLFSGTVKDNAADMVNKSRQAMGVRNGRCKLSPMDVAWVIENSGNVRQVDMAKSLGVTQGAVSKIVRRANWRCISGRAEPK